ncbi:glycosyltransferase family 2 protein [Sphingopyxis witflariensis]|uniref:Glycosyltransferase 2-like domain-containing protein n=1 Tax=Sphingopyxis witflariensis TaxID=173675 RepID=A0A246K5X5_9SPHN|nr:glycosyltransferase family 2 protein [Sphingopyxis witflariensis]OWR01208.1 hypothetical protein CDQ91_01980 [Sphingopyxis witflariensis]
MASQNSDILLSIAIPTKNRQPYLINLVDELLRSDRRDFEIILQDNSDDDQLAAYVAELNDTRVHYAYTNGWISVVDNCDAAVRACSGDYVCMLGDDDGIMLDEALDEMAAAKREGADAVMGAVLLYTWPDITHRSISGLGGKLYRRRILTGRGRADILADARRVVARSGALGLEGLPCVYQGFVSRAVLAAVENRTGSYFPGASPDMANAIGIAAFVKRCRHVERPLIIAGHSRSSGAGRGTMREHRGSIAEQKHLPADTAQTWYSQIPFFWSGPTIYAQSLRSAINRTGATALGVPGDACLYSACFIFERSYAKDIRDAMRHTHERPVTLVPQMIYYALVITAKRAVQFRNNLLVRFFPESAAIEAASIADAIGAVRARLN